MKYIYPAIFTEEEDGILVDFPDLPSCYTDGATLDEAFENAEDALALTLWQMEEEHAAIPAPSALAALHVPHGASVALVRADTLPVRQMNDTRTVRQTAAHRLPLGHLVEDLVTGAAQEVAVHPAKCHPQGVWHRCIKIRSKYKSAAARAAALLYLERIRFTPPAG